MRELFDNSLAPGQHRNDTDSLHISADLTEREEGFRVLTFKDDGESVPLEKLDNLVNYGHKLEAHQRKLSVYGEIGQGLIMTVHALATKAYLFYSCGDVTYVLIAGPVGGEVCSFLLVPP